MKQIGYEVVWTTKRGSRRKVVSTLREGIELFGQKKARGYGSPFYRVAMRRRRGAGGVRFGNAESGAIVRSPYNLARTVVAR